MKKFLDKYFIKAFVIIAIILDMIFSSIFMSYLVGIGFVMGALKGLKDKDNSSIFPYTIGAIMVFIYIYTM